MTALLVHHFGAPETMFGHRRYIGAASTRCAAPPHVAPGHRSRMGGGRIPAIDNQAVLVPQVVAARAVRHAADHPELARDLWAHCERRPLHLDGECA
jgi:hypothetical protein